MLPPVFRCLEGVGKVTITADQDGHVVEIVPAKVKKVRSQHDIDALFHRDALQQLGSPQADLQIWCLAEDIEELLLLNVALGSLAWVLKDIVVVGAE